MEFLEYPKWVTPADGVPVLVQDADEEAALAPKKRKSKTEDKLADEA